MKYFVAVILFLFSLKASALDVVASGFGNNFEEALTNAKVVALDKVNGAWIHGDSYVRDSMFSEKITQYNGGVIKSYKILKNDGNFVIIEADVVPRSNEVKTNSTSVPSSMFDHLKGKIANEAKLTEAIKVIDNRGRALAFETTSVEYKPSGDMTTVVIDGVVSLQEKWKNDYVELQQMSGGFDLPSFYKPLNVSVKGFDFGKEVTSSTFRFYDNLDVYHVSSNGVKIYPKKTDVVRLTFKVPTAKLANVNKFEVNFL